ncbi:MAG: type II toxin-antitoxin system RelE/ParE family toxin [Dehalococcoidia bacterium]|nr:type II toxin-antitoxin system RelE/ParE family toxin [Dehalococcoidia bacterium]
MSVRFRVRLTAQAERSIQRFPLQDRIALFRAIDELEVDPRRPGATRPRFFQTAWRIRVGGYRVIYAILDSDHEVLVARIERRSERTYRDIDQLF